MLYTSFLYGGQFSSKQFASNAGDTVSVPRSGRSPGEGNGNPLQYSCLGNPIDRGVWQDTIRGVAESNTTKQQQKYQLYFNKTTGKNAFTIFILPYFPIFLILIRLSVYDFTEIPITFILVPWNSPGQNTGEGSLSLLQEIFPTQGSNPGLPHCGQILYQLSHNGSSRILEWVACPFSSGSSWPRIMTSQFTGCPFSPSSVGFASFSWLYYHVLWI